MMGWLFADPWVLSAMSALVVLAAAISGLLVLARVVARRG
jgi:hypothetical protein